MIDAKDARALRLLAAVRSARSRLQYQAKEKDKNRTRAFWPMGNSEKTFHNVRDYIWLARLPSLA